MSPATVDNALLAVAYATCHHNNPLPPHSTQSRSYDHQNMEDTNALLPLSRVRRHCVFTRMHCIHSTSTSPVGSRNCLASQVSANSISWEGSAYVYRIANLPKASDLYTNTTSCDSPVRHQLQLLNLVGCLHMQSVLRLLPAF